MAIRSTAVKIDIDQVLALAGDLGRVDAQTFGTAAQAALNETIDRTYQLASDRMTAGINLSDDYLRRRMTTEHASGKTLEASITASGDRAAQTRLATYDAQMVIVPRKTTRASRSRGVLPLNGGRQAGVTVTVSRGAPKTGASLFMLPLRAGAVLGDKFGVFVREKRRIKHLYGPAVYQLLAHQAPRITDEVADDLQRTLLDRVGDEVDRILK
mgnify:CR=1 FL=1